MIAWLSQHWQKIRNALVHTPQALRLVWQANRVATVGLGFLTSGGALLPATQAWVGKLIVDGVVASIQEGEDPEQVQDGFLLSDPRTGSFFCSAPASITRAG